MARPSATVPRSGTQGRQELQGAVAVEQAQALMHALRDGGDTQAPGVAGREQGRVHGPDRPPGACAGLLPRDRDSEGRGKQRFKAQRRDVHDRRARERAPNLAGHIEGPSA